MKGGHSLNSAIIMTLIICCTLLIMYVIFMIDRALDRKAIVKKLNKFDKAFPSIKSPLDKYEKRSKEE